MTQFKKKEFVDVLAKNLGEAGLGSTKKGAEATLNVVRDTIIEIIVEHQAGLTLDGVGTFKVPVRPEREYTNPQDRSQKVVKPAHLDLTFKASKTIKDKLAEYEVVEG